MSLKEYTRTIQRDKGKTVVLGKSYGVNKPVLPPPMLKCDSHRLILRYANRYAIHSQTQPNI